MALGCEGPASDGEGDRSALVTQCHTDTSVLRGVGCSWVTSSVQDVALSRKTQTKPQANSGKKTQIMRLMERALYHAEHLFYFPPTAIKFKVLYHLLSSFPGSSRGCGSGIVAGGWSQAVCAWLPKGSGMSWDVLPRGCPVSQQDQ